MKERELSDENRSGESRREILGENKWKSSRMGRERTEV